MDLKSLLSTGWALADIVVILTQTVNAAERKNSPTPPAGPITITAGADWIALPADLEIEPGSALDFSQLGFVDPPAGKHGRVITRPDGQFAFAGSPAQARRFYGINLCFSGQYLSHEESDRLAERLMRLGYNAVRLHHYEGGLTQGQANSTSFNPRQVDRLDYLTAALIRRGLYLTTDLFVSRPVPYREIGLDRDGPIPMDTYKILVPVHRGAFENWKEFTRQFLTHTNAYTERRYADEPALAWLALINEGNYGNFFKELRFIPEWATAWNRWLLSHYPTRDALARAWETNLLPSEDPADGSVAFPEKLRDAGPRPRDCVAFLSDTERQMVREMKTFVREDLGCHALLSNANSWTYFATDQSARQLYDYVDDHFYVDHPEFLEQPWRLPSKCPNNSPIADGAPSGGRNKSFTRLFDKPFTITEYNYSGPGRFRGVGGILTGALGALQGWGGIWRFAYSHSREAIVRPTRMGYFDLVSDPLSQAAERASFCLFGREDLQPAPHRVMIRMTEEDLSHPPARIPNLHPRWHWTAWITQVGTLLGPPDAPASRADLMLPLGWKTPAAAYPFPAPAGIDPYAANDGQILDLLRSRGIVSASNPTDPARKSFRSETGELTLDGPGNIMILDTLKTAGGFAPAGHKILTVRGGVEIDVEGTDATVWVSALDGQPIRQSKRLLVTHLTDLQNTNIRYAEPERKTLLDWGELPYLVRAGRAIVVVKLDQAADYTVWAIGLSGKRGAEVPSHADAGTFTFAADIAGDPTSGARLMYEIAPR